MSTVLSLAILTYAACGLLLLRTAWEADRGVEDRTRAVVAATLEAERLRLEQIVRDYASSAGAIRRLVEAGQISGQMSGGAYADPDVPALARDSGVDSALVIGTRDDTLDILAAGPPGVHDLGAVRGGLEQLLTAAKTAGLAHGRVRSVPVSGNLLLDGVPAVAAAAILSGDGAAIGKPPGDGPRVLVFMVRLSPSFLTTLARRLALERLAVALGIAPASPAQIHLETEDGTPIVVAWSASSAGMDIAARTLPWYAAGGAGLGIVAWLAMAGVSARSRREPAQAAPRTDEARFRDLAPVAVDWVWETDAELRLSYLSDRFEAMTGKPGAAFIGRDLEDVLHPSGTAIATWAAEETWNGVLPALRCRYITQAGEVRICRTVAKVVLDPAGARIGLLGTATDITDQVEAHWRVEQLALHDPLTSLPNRLLLMEFLAGALSAAREGGRRVAVLYADLDHFQQINESFGLAVADKVLVETAQRLRQCARDNDLVARVGADEFILVASGAGSATGVENLCQRLKAALSRPILADGSEIQPHAAVGVALAPGDADDPEGLLRCAELALQQAKQDGPGSYCFFSAEMNEQVLFKRSLENDLRRSIGSEEFRLFFQPRFETATRRLVAVEALVRWDHPRLGHLAPDRFIPLAESSGLIIPLGEWVMRRACAVVARWPGLNVSVNVSPVQFRQGDLVSTVESAIAESRMPQGRLELEITENVLMENSEKALDILLGLKGLGLRLAMDDFGTGYSSLGYLRTFPFDAIKIDRRFVGDMEESAGALAIVQAIVGLGRALGMNVIAEGVEKAEQLDLLRRERCDEVQGFHLARPMSEEALAAFLAARADEGWKRQT